MKIIKRGTKEEKVYIAKCRTCGCRFIYKQSDIMMTSDLVLEDIIEYVACPQCQHAVSIPFIRKKYQGDKKIKMRELDKLIELTTKLKGELDIEEFDKDGILDDFINLVNIYKDFLGGDE